MGQWTMFQLAAVSLVDRLRAAKERGKEGGASAVEYALLIALIAAVIVVAVWALGQFVFGAFANTCNSIADSSGIATCQVAKQ